MFIEVTATGSNGAVATGTMHLNFNAKQYCIERYTGWGRTAFSVVGTFAPAGRSIILTDQNTPQYGNKITIEGAPVGENDTSSQSGKGRLESGISPAFAEAAITWKQAAISALRLRILDIIDREAGFSLWPTTKKDFPSGPPSDAVKKAVAAARAAKKLAPIPESKTKVTNCGQFPGWVAKRIGGKVPADLFKIFNNGYGDLALTAPMTAWDVYAQTVEKFRGASSAGAIWKPYSNGAGRPLPGDIYVLGESPGGKFAHVGIMYDPSTNLWITADAGQGGGFEGCKQRRAWDSYAGAVTLVGAPSQPDSGTRYLLGWINVDALIPNWSA